jgi:hypothetical protein
MHWLARKVQQARSFARKGINGANTFARKYVVPNTHHIRNLTELALEQVQAHHQETGKGGHLLGKLDYAHNVAHKIHETGNIRDAAIDHVRSKVLYPTSAVKYIH